MSGPTPSPTASSRPTTEVQPRALDAITNEQGSPKRNQLTDTSLPSPAPSPGRFTALPPAAAVETPSDDPPMFESTPRPTHTQDSTNPFAHSPVAGPSSPPFESIPLEDIDDLALFHRCDGDLALYQAMQYDEMQRRTVLRDGPTDSTLERTAEGDKLPTYEQTLATEPPSAAVMAAARANQRADRQSALYDYEHLCIVPMDDPILANETSAQVANYHRRRRRRKFMYTLFIGVLCVFLGFYFVSRFYDGRSSRSYSHRY